jgi:hypothetical protein
VRYDDAVRAGLILVTIAVGVHAHAQPANDPKAAADRAAAEAQALADRGDLLGAATKFREAYRHDPRPELLCNVGVAYHKANDLPRAQLLLSQCLTRGTSLEPEFVTAVRAVLAAVEEQLRAGDFTPLDVIVAPDGATVVVGAFGADDAFVGSRLLYVPYGAHTVTVTMEGYLDRSEQVDATTRDQRTVSVALERRPEQKIRYGPRPSKKPAVIATVATGAAVIVALGGYAWAFNRAGDAADAADRRDYPAYRESRGDARFWQRKVAWVAAGAAGVGAVVSGFLWVRASTGPRVEIEPTAGGAAVSLSGRF